MPIVLMSANQAFDLPSIQNQVAESYEAEIEERGGIRMLIIRKPDEGLVLQINDEDAEGNSDIMGDYASRSDLPQAFLESLKARSLHFILVTINSNFIDEAVEIAKRLVLAGMVEFISTSDDGVVAAREFVTF